MNNAIHENNMSLPRYAILTCFLISLILSFKCHLFLWRDKCSCLRSMSIRYFKYSTCSQTASSITSSRAVQPWRNGNGITGGHSPRREGTGTRHQTRGRGREEDRGEGAASRAVLAGPPTRPGPAVYTSTAGWQVQPDLNHASFSPTWAEQIRRSTSKEVLHLNEQVISRFFKTHFKKN